jgi:hypothetical protein
MRTFWRISGTDSVTSAKSLAVWYLIGCMASSVHVNGHSIDGLMVMVHDDRRSAIERESHVIDGPVAVIHDALPSIGLISGKRTTSRIVR